MLNKIFKYARERGLIGGKLHADKSMLTIMTDLTERLSVWVQAEVNRWMQFTILVFINFVSKVEICPCKCISNVLY